MRTHQGVYAAGPLDRADQRGRLIAFGQRRAAVLLMRTICQVTSKMSGRIRTQHALFALRDAGTGVEQRRIDEPLRGLQRTCFEFVPVALDERHRGARVRAELLQLELGAPVDRMGGAQHAEIASMTSPMLPDRRWCHAYS
jgi:hypothetical protein